MELWALRASAALLTALPSPRRRRQVESPKSTLRTLAQKRNYRLRMPKIAFERSPRCRYSFTLSYLVRSLIKNLRRRAIKLLTKDRFLRTGLSFGFLGQLRCVRIHLLQTASILARPCSHGFPQSSNLTDSTFGVSEHVIHHLSVLKKMLDYKCNFYMMFRRMEEVQNCHPSERMRFLSTLPRATIQRLAKELGIKVIS